MSDHQLHPSSIGQWSICPKRAWYALDNSGGREVPTVAAWVGEVAHAIAVGHETPGVPDYTMLYDSITPDSRTGYRQANTIVLALRQLLDTRGLTIQYGERAVENEAFAGTLDMILRRDVSRNRIVADLKTGQEIPTSVWLQLGAYFEAYTDEMIDDPGDEPTDTVMVIHAPRTSLFKPQTIRFHERDGRSCAKAARVMSSTVTRWLTMHDFDSVPAMPSHMCHSCPLTSTECVVRAVDSE